MRVKLGSVAFLTAAGSGYGIGLDDTGRRVEFATTGVPCLPSSLG